jgi:hypothetical protein
MLMQQDSGISATQASANTDTGNAQIVATLAAVAGKTQWIEGFDLGGLGATAAQAIKVTIAGLLGGSIVLKASVGAGVTLKAFQNDQFVVRFPEPLPASAVNTAITVTVAAYGAGNTDASVVAYGFQK